MRPAPSVNSVSEDPSSRQTLDRRWTFGSVAYFVVATAALVAPIYTEVANRVEPRVFHLPFSLVWILGVIAANTLVLTLMYRRRAFDAETREDEMSVPADGADANTDERTTKHSVARGGLPRA